MLPLCHFIHPVSERLEALRRGFLSELAAHDRAMRLNERGLPFLA